MATIFNDDAFFGLPDNTGGARIKLPDGDVTPVDNVFIVQDGTNKFKIHPHVKGVYHASWILNTTGDKTTYLQGILNHADVNILVVERGYTLTGTLTIPSGKKVKFAQEGKFIGGTITGTGVIEAPDNQHIFDLTTNLVDVRFEDEIFHAKWWGATGAGLADDQPQLQKALDFLAKNDVGTKTLKFPSGTFRIGKGLLIWRDATSDGDPDQVNVKVIGSQGAITENGTTETVIECTHSNNFGLALQKGKGIIVENLNIKGTNVLNYNYEQAWFTGSYIQGIQRTNKYSPYAGIVLDGFSSLTGGADRYPGFESYYSGIVGNGGSTDCVVRNCTIDGFVCGIILSPAYGVQNNEAHVFDKIWISNCKDGFVTTNSQERTVKCTNFKFWNSVHTCFRTIGYGADRGEVPQIDGVNVAGTVYQCFLFSGFGGYFPNININNFYAESFYKIGIVTGTSVTFQGCHFAFANVPDVIAGRRNPQCQFITTVATFLGCTVLYYTGGPRIPMNFHGFVVFDGGMIGNAVAHETTDWCTNFEKITYKNNAHFYTDEGNANDGFIDSVFLNYYVFAYGTQRQLAVANKEYVSFRYDVPLVDNSNYFTQHRRVKTDMVRKNRLGSAVSVTVSGNTATATGVFNLSVGEIIYAANLSLNNGAVTAIGYACMRAASTDGAGNWTFDYVIEGMVTGSYELYSLTLNAICPVSFADYNNGALTNIYREGTSVAWTIPSNFYVVNNNRVYITGTGAGTGTMSPIYGGSIAEGLIICDYEYDEWGYSFVNPLTNPYISHGVAFTKGSIYTNRGGVVGESTISGWICTKSGIFGSANPPEFEDLLSGGGGGIGTLDQVLELGNVSDEDITVANVISTSITSGTGNFSVPSGTALLGASTTGLAASLSISPASTNTIVKVLDIVRHSSGTASSGIGASINYNVEIGDGSTQISNILASRWAATPLATRTSTFTIEGVNLGVLSTILSLSGSGALQLPRYTTAVSGTPIFGLGVDSGGNVVTTSVGGGGVTSASNGLTLTGTNVKLGGTLTEFTTISGGSNTFAVTSSSFSASSFFENTGVGNALWAESVNGVGITAKSTNNVGIWGFAEHAGLPGQFTHNTTNTNTTSRVASFVVQSANTVASGFGGFVDFSLETTGGTIRQASVLRSSWTNVADASRSSKFEILNTLSGVSNLVAVFNADGSIQFPDYSTAVTGGALAFMLGVDATGKVITTTPVGTGDMLKNADNVMTSSGRIRFTSTGADSKIQMGLSQEYYFTASGVHRSFNLNWNGSNWVYNTTQKGTYSVQSYNGWSFVTHGSAASGTVIDPITTNYVSFSVINEGVNVQNNSGDVYFNFRINDTNRGTDGTGYGADSTGLRMLSSTGKMQYRDDGGFWTDISSSAGGGMTNPMTTQYDLIIGGGAGAPTRIAKGIENEVIAVGGDGVVSYAKLLDTIELGEGLEAYEVSAEVDKLVLKGVPDVQTNGTFLGYKGDVWGMHYAVTEVNNFGNTSNSKGASIVGNSIILEPASTLHPGGLLAANQTVFGDKTFAGDAMGVTGTGAIGIVGSGITYGGSFTSENIALLANGPVKFSSYTAIGSVTAGTPIGHLSYDADGNIIAGDLVTGGGGITTASNGLTVTGTNVALGGSLAGNVNITTGAFALTVSTSTSGVGPLQTTATTGNAFSGTASSGVGIYGSTATGYSGYFTASGTGTGLFVESVNGLPLRVQNFPSSTNNVSEVVTITRGSTGTAANGIGAGIGYYVEASDGQSYESTKLISKWTDVTLATRSSSFEIWGTKSAVHARKAAFTDSSFIVDSSFGGAGITFMPLSTSGATGNIYIQGEGAATDIATSFNLVPKGAGGASFESQVNVWITDGIADNVTNFELMRWRASATSGYLFDSVAGGTGTAREIHFQLSSTTKMSITATGIRVVVPTYADDTAAGVGGLTTGDVYVTAAGDLKMKL